VSYWALLPFSAFVYLLSLLPLTMLFSTTIARPLQLVTRVLQWASAVIVMGLTSYFINRGPRGQHTIYQEVIVRYSRFLPLTDHHRAIISNRKPTYVGCPLRRLLPSGIHFAIHALVVEQICARYRRRLLLPVCQPATILPTSKSLIPF
jgi:hypothetical protein